MIGSDAYWKTKGKYDLIVIGAGHAGIGASIAAARRGMKVALIERYGFAGGVATQSCCPIFYGVEVEGEQTTGGLSDEFVNRMDKRGAGGIEVSLPFGWLGNLQSDMEKMAQNNQHSIGSTIEKYRKQVIANIEKTYAEYPTHISIKTEE